MKGIETLPFQLIASLVLITVVISVGWYEIGQFLEFKVEKDFKEGIAGIYQNMRHLQALSDLGAFSGTSLSIPGGYSMEIDPSADTIIGRDQSGLAVITIPSPDGRACIDILAVKREGDVLTSKETYGPSSYEFRILYTSDTSTMPIWSIAFNDTAGC